MTSTDPIGSKQIKQDIPSSAQHGDTAGLPPYMRALLAGAVAGTTVDLSLFPLDTLKTRLQSPSGFLASGGFRGIYAGLGSVLLGSAPSAALFFVSYDGIKRYLASSPSSLWQSAASQHMLAACAGEIAACAVRVPTEVVKQRAQAASANASSRAMLLEILQQRHHTGLGGVWRELYRGWGVTVLREVPFTMIQFPLWEALKSWRQRTTTIQHVNPAESAFFGALSGGLAAALTTPLDVLKTRMMLSRGAKEPVWLVASTILRTEGLGVFAAGMVPRVIWIGIGGAVFLGSYDWAYNLLSASLKDEDLRN